MLALHRLLPTSSVHSLQVYRCQVRLLHASTPGFKKKKKLVEKTFDFEEDDDDADFFSFESESIENVLETQTKTMARTQDIGAVKGNEKRTSINGMQSAFVDALYTNTLEKLKQRPQIGQPPRKGTISRLIALAQTKEDLQKILELAKEWRSQPPDLTTSDLFFGRCSRLGYPEIALQSLQNRASYGMDLSSLSSARRLLYALAQPRHDYDSRHLLTDCVALAELYPSYGFPPASKDLVSCAIIASALSHRLPKRKEVKDEQALGISADLKTAWSTILVELENAAAAWETHVPTLNPRTAHWMRACLSNIVRTFQGVRNSTPWVASFREALGSVGSPHHRTTGKAS